MTFDQFHNGLRVLMNISQEEFLACCNIDDREHFGDGDLLNRFRLNPHRYFVGCPTQDAKRLFDIIARRNQAAGLVS